MDRAPPRTPFFDTPAGLGSGSVRCTSFLHCQSCLDCSSCCQRHKPSQSNELVLQLLCSPRVLSQGRPKGEPGRGSADVIQYAFQRR